MRHAKLSMASCGIIMAKLLTGCWNRSYCPATCYLPQPYGIDGDANRVCKLTIWPFCRAMGTTGLAGVSENLSRSIVESLKSGYREDNRSIFRKSPRKEFSTLQKLPVRGRLSGQKQIF
ncbi:hypothetical protein V2W45_1403493, partial [Cenococcum geophilum]